jgi:hypothetical protein
VGVSVQYIDYHRFYYLGVVDAPPSANEVAIVGDEKLLPDTAAQPTQASAAAVTFLKFRADLYFNLATSTIIHEFENVTFWCAPPSELALSLCLAWCRKLHVVIVSCCELFLFRFLST